MYKGTLINDLIATVERLESNFSPDPGQEAKLSYWYALAESELASLDGRNLELAGVA
jgi:hypothetical protein